MVPRNRTFTAEAAQQIGISKATLLRWFAQKKIDEVARDVRGWRVFTNRDINRIKKYANTIESPEARSRA